jgi:hypothetical protein
MNLFTALLGGRASTLHGRVVPDSGDLRIRTHSRSWDCGCYRWSVVFDAWPAIFEASRALPQARFRSSASLPLDSTEPPSLHHGIASTTTARIAEERSSSGSSCPTTSQLAGLEERGRERGHYSRHQLPSPTSSTAAEHKVVSRGPEEA